MGPDSASYDSPRPPTSAGSDRVPSVPGFAGLSPLGRGGFASVFAATDVVLGRRVALKVISVSQRDQLRFERECKILASLAEAPGVVPVHAASETTDGRPVIVMKLYEGGSLTEVVRSAGPLSIDKTLLVGERLCAALVVAHGRGIYHRDIKPDNVLFSLSGEPALGDFGIATLAEAIHSTETLGSLSPPHAPPERFAGAPDSWPAAGDVYSLGSTLYYCLVGAPPFGTAVDGGLAGLLRRVAEDPLPRIARADLPAKLQSVLATAMAKAPGDRYRSIDELVAALSACREAAIDGEPGDRPGLITGSLVASVTSLPGKQQESVEQKPPAPLAPAPPPAASAPTPPEMRPVALADAAMTSASSSVDRTEPSQTRRPLLPRVLVAIALVLTLGVAVSMWWMRDDTTGERAGEAIALVEAMAPGSDTSGSVGTEPTVTTTLSGQVASPSTVTTVGLDERLVACSFTGTADLSPGVASESTGPQTLVLARGSTIACDLASGASRRGALDLHAEFADLRYRTGSGAGDCTMSWDDGSVSACRAEVTLSFPTISFQATIVEGPHTGQVGTAVIEGWQPYVGPDGATIVQLVLPPTLLQFS